jgi:hypothetical protein
MARKTDGTLWLKSPNAMVIASAFVHGPTEDLTQIGKDRDWTQVYAGFNSFFARKKDGSWWVCGLNYEGQIGLGPNITAVPSPQRFPFDFDPWAFAPGGQTTILLGIDGKLWTWGKRLGAGQPSAARLKIQAFLAAMVKRFPSLGFLIKSDIDQTPHLLWELPPEVRRALGTGPKSATNNSTLGQPTDASHE